MEAFKTVPGMLRNLKILSKAIILLLLMAFVAAGMVFYAITSINGLAEQTRRIVDVQAVRLEQLLTIRVRANEAAVNARNMILKTREKEIAGYKTRYDTIVKSGLDAANTLIALADTPASKRDNEALTQVFEALIAIMDRSNVLGSKNDNDSATKVLLNDGIDTRFKFRDTLQKRIDEVKSEINQSNDSAKYVFVQAKMVLLVAAIVSLLTALGLAAAIIVFGITRPSAAGSACSSAWPGARSTRRSRRRPAATRSARWARRSRPSRPWWPRRPPRKPSVGRLPRPLPPPSAAAR